jgi:hypothetical protein
MTTTTTMLFPVLIPATFFNADGFYQATAFCIFEECAAMKQQSNGAFVQDDWDPDQQGVWTPLGTDTEHCRATTFLESSDQIHTFYRTN